MKLLYAYLLGCTTALAVASPITLGQSAELSQKRLLLTTPADQAPVLAIKANKASKATMCFEANRNHPSCIPIKDGQFVVPSAAVRKACK